jgi:hypothetical protein
MWQFWGTLSVSAFGGAFFIYYLTNFLLTEKAKFAFDWDGVIERALITYCVLKPGLLWWLTVIIAVKLAARLAAFGWQALYQTKEPGLISQKVKTKSELALELCLSPLFAFVIGVVF